MSTQVDTALVQQYSANISLLAQQMTSLIANNCRKESVNAETSYFDQIGKAQAIEVTSRHAATQRSDTPHARRSVSLKQLVYTDWIDEFDKVRMIGDPTSQYVKAAVSAIAREKDTNAITALLGDSQTGKSGSTTTSLPSSQKVPVAASGLTFSKILAAREILDSNDVDPFEKRFLVLAPKQYTELLQMNEATNNDFVNNKALASGMLPEFMGFHIIKSNLLSTDGSGDRQAIAYTESGLLCAFNKVETMIDQLPDHNYSYQVFHREFVGFTRMEEEKVVEIACSEA